MPKHVVYTIEERLNRKIERIPFSTCWHWVGATLPKGYGQFGHREFPGDKPKVIYAHRASYELYKGRIPEGYEIDHLCKNTGCCNPDHLEAVTPLENNRRSNSVAATHFRKTHCVNGHEFTPDNTRLRGKDKQWRACKECDRLWKKKD
jgi:hypothetical protein